MANYIALALVLGVAALAIRSVWRDHKSGKSCGGDCSHCKGCH